MKIKNQPRFDINLQEMLVIRTQLSFWVGKMSRSDALALEQQIAEIDGYLTLQAPTHTAH